MAPRILFSLLPLLLLPGPASPDPVTLTPATFDDVVDGTRGVMVMFFAPWCGHCKALAPTYDDVADAFAYEPAVVVAKLDADAHRDFSAVHGVAGFPTLLWFRAITKEAQVYDEGRAATDIAAFINRETGLANTVHVPPSHLDELTPGTFDQVALDQTRDVLVVFYAPWCGHCKALMPEMEEAGATFDGEASVSIVKVDADAHRDLAAKYDVSGYPTLRVRGKREAEDRGRDSDRGRDREGRDRGRDSQR